MDMHISVILLSGGICFTIKLFEINYIMKKKLYILPFLLSFAVFTSCSSDDNNEGQGEFHKAEDVEHSISELVGSLSKTDHNRWEFRPVVEQYPWITQDCQGYQILINEDGRSLDAYKEGCVIDGSYIKTGTWMYPPTTGSTVEYLLTITTIDHYDLSGYNDGGNNTEE